MKLIENLDLDDPKTKEWMDVHFKKGEYCILSVSAKDEKALVDTLVQLNLNIVLIPSLNVQIMVNLREVTALVRGVREAGFNMQVPSNIQALLDFADDSKKGTAQ